MWDVIDYCYSRKKQFILGCNASAHYILQGTTDTNPRCEALMEYMVSVNLHILQAINQSTYLCGIPEKGH
jgi:hypothetical protein